MHHTFINYTNHPSATWSPEQLKAAQQYGEIIDIPFPNVSPTLTTQEVAALSEEQCELILKYAPGAVLCQGEFSLAYDIIKRLKAQNITVLAACSERNTVTIGNERRSIFCFIQFREYT